MGAAKSLGDEGRVKIKGREVKYYLEMINEVREKIMVELKKKDDKMNITPKTKYLVLFIVSFIGLLTFLAYFIFEQEANKFRLFLRICSFVLFIYLCVLYWRKYKHN